MAFISEAEIYNNFKIEPLLQSFDSIAVDFKVCIFLKAEYKNVIVGSVRGKETSEICQVGRLIVAPEFQNKGIGRRLLKEIEHEFPAAREYELCTGYKSIKNIYLYESIGYKQCEVITDDGHPNLQMVKMIKENNKNVKFNT
jgi:GNAT superfamily N-acetyltransferase